MAKRLNITLSMHPRDIELLDRLAKELGLTRSACVRALVARYYRDSLTDDLWCEHLRTVVAKNGRKVE